MRQLRGIDGPRRGIRRFGAAAIAGGLTVRKALYILADLEDEDIIWMSRAGAVREIGAGETLIHAGSPVSHLYFVTEGALEVVTRAGARIAELGLGEVIGEMSFVEKRVPSVN